MGGGPRMFACPLREVGFPLSQSSDGAALVDAGEGAGREELPRLGSPGMKV